jgi:hypothetical protein
MFKRNSQHARLALATVFAALTLGASVSVVSAQGYYDRYDRRGRMDKNEVREIGRRNGYQMGLREGRFDAQRGGRLDYKRSEAYRNGMIGYRYEFDNEGAYRGGFRNGFEDGYRNAYNNSGRGYGYGNGRNFPDWGRSGGWGNRNDNDDWNRRRRF